MSVSGILDKIIKPEFRGRFNNWQSYAKPIDLLGLYCLDDIYKSKGTRKLTTKGPAHEQPDMQITKSSFFGETATRIVPTTTTYSFYHGSMSAPKKLKSSIFQFKSLADMKLSKPLTAMTVAFVDTWLHLRDSSKYEEAVLNCLRSLNSKLQLAQPHNTEMKTVYGWSNDWSLSKPIRLDKAGEQLFAFKPNYAAIQKQELKKEAHRKKMQELEKSQFAAQLNIFKDFKIN